MTGWCSQLYFIEGYDLTNNKEILSSDGEITLNTNYIYEEIDEKGCYYTYDAEKFYEK